MPHPWHGLLASCAWLKSKLLRRLSKLQQQFKPWTTNKLKANVFEMLVMCIQNFARLNSRLLETNRTTQGRLCLHVAAL